MNGIESNLSLFYSLSFSLSLYIDCSHSSLELELLLLFKYLTTTMID